MEALRHGSHKAFEAVFITSFSYRINKKKVSHELSVKILNAGMNIGMHFYEYNEKASKIKQIDGTGLIPNNGEFAQTTVSARTFLPHGTL